MLERQVPFFEAAFVIFVLVLGTGIVNIFPMVYIAGSPLYTFFWLASYLGVGVILCLHYGIQWLSWFGRYRSLLAIVILAALVSVSWSVDPALSLQRAIHLAGTTLVAYYIGFHLPSRTALLLLAWALTIIIIGNTFVALAIPELGQESIEGAQAWKGWHYQKNGLGFTATIACLFFAVRTLSVDVRSRWVYGALSVLSFGVLLKSGSATALVTLLAGAGLALSLFLANGLRLRGWVTGLMLSLLLLLMGIAGVVVFIEGEFEAVTGLVGRSANLTGRLPLWEEIWSLVMKRPWLGYGYGAVWRPKPGTVSIIGALLERRLEWLPPHAHNAFLNIASELGLPIATIAMFYAFQTFLDSLRLHLRHPTPFALLVVALLTAMIVGTFTEQVIFKDRSIHWIIFVALPILLLRATPSKRHVVNEATHAN